MTAARRNRGFERLGEIRPGDLDLSRRDARRLLLEHAWRSVAGEALTPRLRAVQASRGTLEVEADARWAAALGPMVPRLAAQVAARFPALGVRRFRLRILGDRNAGRPQPIAAEPAPDPLGPTSPRPSAPAAHGGGDWDSRLRRAAERYLSRDRSRVR